MVSEPRQACHNLNLCQQIADRIAAQPQQRVPFADYMDWVLYDPEAGYYATNTAQIGVRGDFFTSPHLGPDFGELLAEQFLEMWQMLEQPTPFTVVEMGAGQGLIAADVLNYLNDRAHAIPDPYGSFWAALRYILIEKAQGLITAQQDHLQRTCQHSNKLSWATLETLPQGGITGCFFSNELVDALPVHPIVYEAGTLQEVYVAIAQPSHPYPFTEVLAAPSTPKLAEYLAWLGIDLHRPDYTQGYRSEINLAALDWLQAVTDHLQRGYLLTIDYGYTAAQYYHPARSQGTLQCYRHHGAHSDPYAYIGHQDITAHVNFTALSRYGEQLGLQTVGWTQQGLFLMALGLGDRLVANNTTPDLSALSTVIRRREALHALISPMGLGNFQVLIQSKGLEGMHSLKGLRP